MMACYKTNNAAKLLADVVRDRVIDEVKLVVVLNSENGGCAAYVYAPGGAGPGCYGRLYERFAGIVPDETWHLLVAPVGSAKHRYEECEEIYAAVKREGNVAYLGGEYKVYYADVREVPVMAAVTPQYGDGHGLPPKVSLQRLYRDDVTGCQYATLDELIQSRRLEAARRELATYLQKDAVALGEALRSPDSDVATLVLQAMLDLAPNMMSIMKEHKLP